MQERYTKQAENVLALAKEAASSCGHSYIGTEHSAGRACRRKGGHRQEEFWRSLESRLIKRWL